MSAPLAVLAATGSNSPTWSDDVFSSFVYTGNGSTQTITNGIDLAGKGGLVWLKKRGAGIADHHLYDTVRGATNMLSSNTTGATIVRSTGLTAFNSDGFAIGAYSEINGSGDTQVGWTFRKAAKFFDCGTYTGDGVAGRTVNHNLGAVPGMIVVKRTDTTADWVVYHRSATNVYMKLNTTDGPGGNDPSGVIFGNGTSWGAGIDSTKFTVGSNLSAINATGGTYVYYAFAHDTTTDGLIQCGSYTANSGTPVSINLGWEPQFVLVKCSTQANQWVLTDVMRGASQTSTATLFANGSGAESVSASGDLIPSATGFTVGAPSYFNNGTQTYIYLAIRRPNKPPTSGTQVYNAIARTGTGAAATVTGVGFAPDAVWVGLRNKAGYNPPATFNRLVGPTKWQLINTNAEETNSTSLTSYNMDGVSYGTDTVGYVNYDPAPLGSFNYINWFLRRAPGVFDVVCYTGTGSARTVSHNLGVAPELMIVKGRTGGISNWYVYAGDATKNLFLNATNANTTSSAPWNNTAPTSSAFTAGSANSDAAYTYVAYLFATKAGISSVGSYTGNGGSQTINCGFSAGARFILIKRTDSTGDWYVWDSTRGIVAGNDPHLSLNTTAAEVTTNDSIDPDSSGYIVNQLAATNINVNGGSYIFLAVA